MKLRAASAVGKTPAPPGGDGTVALVRGGALGDFVLTLPVAEALRAAVPGARFVVAGHPDRAALAHPDDIIDADSRDWSSLFAGTVPETLRRRLPDCHCLVAFAAGADGPFATALRDLCDDVRIADPRPQPGDGRHMAAQLLDPVRVETLHLPPTPTPRLPLVAQDPARDLVVVHPGSGSPRKCWPADRFAALLEALRRDGRSCAVLWGPAEAQRAGELGHRFPPEVARWSPATPLDLARCLASARLYVGNDSGPGHLAAAVGRPTVSLFGPTDPRLWRPLGPSATVVEAPDGDLAGLEVARVLEVVQAALEADGWD